MERRNNMRIIAACLLASIIATIFIPLLTVFTLFIMLIIAYIRLVG